MQSQGHKGSHFQNEVRRNFATQYERLRPSGCPLVTPSSTHHILWAWYTRTLRQILLGRSHQGG